MRVRASRHGLVRPHLLDERPAPVDRDRDHGGSAKDDRCPAPLTGPWIERRTRPAHRADRPVDEDPPVDDRPVAALVASIDAVGVAAIGDDRARRRATVPGHRPGRLPRERP